MNGYDISVVLNTTTAVVRGEGGASEIPVTEPAKFNLRTR